MDLIILDCAPIRGECALKGYEGKITALAFNHGIAQPITSDPSNQKRTGGQPHHQDFTLTKNLDLATPILIDYCNQAKPLPTVTLTVGHALNNTFTPYMLYTLTNVLISSISVAGSGSGRPQETLTLNYSAIAWDYKLQNATGVTSAETSASWNLATDATS